MKKDMRKILAAVFTSLVLFGCNISTDGNDQPDTGPGPGIPVVAASQFQIGDSFVWSHFRGNSPNSEQDERFTVRAINGNMVLFLVEERPQGYSQWQEYEQFQADLGACVRLESSGQGGFTIGMYSGVSGTWQYVGESPTTAILDQKFNCNLSLAAGEGIQTMTATLGPGDVTLLRIASPGDDPSTAKSWFITDSGNIHGLLGRAVTPIPGASERVDLVAVTP